MSHTVDFFTRIFGGGGHIAAAIIFPVLAILGVVIAIRGRQLMVVLAEFCGSIIGIFGGAMIGLLSFDSFILMLVLAFAGGTALMLFVHYVKSVGYFIGIFALGFFMSYIITSDMYIASTRVTYNTLLLLDLAVGAVLGIMAAIRSKYLVSLVTAISGGVTASISTFATFGFYFANAKTWILAAAVAIFGMFVQIHTYDIRGGKNAEKRAIKNKASS